MRRFAIRFDLSDFTDPVRIEKDLMQIMPQREWWGFNHRLVYYGNGASCCAKARLYESSSHITISKKHQEFGQNHTNVRTGEAFVNSERF